MDANTSSKVSRNSLVLCFPNFPPSSFVSWHFEASHRLKRIWEFSLHRDELLSLQCEIILTALIPTELRTDFHPTGLGILIILPGSPFSSPIWAWGWAFGRGTTTCSTLLHLISGKTTGGRTNTPAGSGGGRRGVCVRLNFSVSVCRLKSALTASWSTFLDARASFLASNSAWMLSLRLITAWDRPAKSYFNTTSFCYVFTLNSLIAQGPVSQNNWSWWVFWSVIVQMFLHTSPPNSSWKCPKNPVHGTGEELI